jgi:prepilin-type N-terminal cleavage/methylation domain-containing protein
MNKNKKFAGFTLIELLITIVIIGILATISVATFGKYQEKARIAAAQAMAKQFQDLVLAKNASTENITIFELANFDGENDFIGNTIIDKSGFENNLTLQSNYSGALSLISDDSVSGIGKSFRIRDRIFGTNVVRHDALSASQNGKFTLSCWFKLENYPTNWEI